MIAIDLGSNTLRAVQFDCATMESVIAYEKVVKTADGLMASGKVSDEATERIIIAIKEAKTKLDFSLLPVYAVTTEAIRRASNAQAVLSKIKAKTGVEFEIISGEEEARLTLIAIKNRLKHLKFSTQNFVAVDIGGGSTELIFHYNSIVQSRSFPIGIVTMAQTYQTLDAIRDVLPEAMKEMRLFCQTVVATYGKFDAFLATAGTPTTIAAMKLGQNYKTYNPHTINGTSLHKNEPEYYLDKLLSMSYEQREITVGVGRFELIATGILIFRYLYTILDADWCVVVDDGLREGVALERCR